MAEVYAERGIEREGLQQRLQTNTYRFSLENVLATLPQAQEFTLEECFIPDQIYLTLISSYQRNVMLSQSAKNTTAKIKNEIKKVPVSDDYLWKELVPHVKEITHQVLAEATARHDCDMPSRLAILDYHITAKDETTHGMTDTHYILMVYHDENDCLKQIGFKYQPVDPSSNGMFVRPGIAREVLRRFGEVQITKVVNDSYEGFINENGKIQIGESNDIIVNVSGYRGDTHINLGKGDVNFRHALYITLRCGETESPTSYVRRLYNEAIPMEVAPAKNRRLFEKTSV